MSVTGSLARTLDGSLQLYCRPTSPAGQLGVAMLIAMTCPGGLITPRVASDNGSSGMEIRVRDVGEFAILELTGRLTVNDQPGLLRESVNEAVGRGARTVLIDLSGVRYIDSTRLGELITAHITVSRQGGKLRLVGTPDTILELLAIAGLDGIFPRYATIEDATGEFRA
jgi:anti-sigma B factor antagonist